MTDRYMTKRRNQLLRELKKLEEMGKEWV